MGGKRYNNIRELIEGVSESESFAKETLEHIDKRFIVHRLYGTRTVKGVSQQEMAERLNCSQSRISKLENSEDDDLRLGDLKRYLHAIGMNLTVFISKEEWRAVDQIKFHAFMIRKILDHLTELAKDDPEIAKGVQHWHLETLFNLVKLVTESAVGLPDFDQKMPPLIEADDSVSSCSSASSSPRSTSRSSSSSTGVASRPATNAEPAPAA